MRFLKPLFLRRYHEFQQSRHKIFLYREQSALLLLFMIFVALAFWSWRKWPDILIDFGRELYIPWQLASGKVLYKDIAFFSGPFAQYFNALIFYLFGTSFINLVYSNLIITALLTLFIYLFFKKACDQYAAIFSCIVFLTFFAFAHFDTVGNYNWICPYSHDLTHGIFLSCVMLLIFQKCFFRLRPGLLALAGICLGFILLTKMEVSLAAVASALVGNALIFWIHKPRLGRALALLSLFLGAALIPIIGCFVFLGKDMPTDEVLRHLSLSWRAIYDGAVVQNKFYLRITGLDSPERNLVLMGAGVLGIFFFAGGAIMIDLSKTSPVKKRQVLIILSVLLFVGALFIKFCPGLIYGKSLSPMSIIQWAFFTGFYYWLIIGRSLPLITLILGMVLIWLFIKRVRVPKIAPDLASLIMWGVLAFVLLGKILLNSNVYHYGFALAMPATILLVAGFLWLIPKALKRLDATGLTARRMLMAALLTDIILALIWSNNIYSPKHFSVGQGGDRIITYQTRLSLGPAGPSISELLKQIERLVPKQANLACIPEGIMMNYLSRRPNPTRYTGLTPPEMIIYGEANIFKSLSDAQPDFIVIIPRETTEYGVGFFGEDPNYGRDIMAWISDDYEKVWQEPLQYQRDSKFGISIFRQKKRDHH